MIKYYNDQMHALQSQLSL